MHARRLLHTTEQHIRELNEQIVAHRTLMRELASEGQDVRDHERTLQLMIEAQARDDASAPSAQGAEQAGKERCSRRQVRCLPQPCFPKRAVTGRCLRAFLLAGNSLELPLRPAPGANAIWRSRT